MKKIRLLATFCLRRLLTVTTKQVCLDVWPVLMPEPQPVTNSNSPQPSSIAMKKSQLPSRLFQPDFITLIIKERDLRLRQIFIEIFRGLLSNVESRFAIAEELSSWHSAAFIPYSVRLAAELRTLHRRLSWALISERNGNHQLIFMKVINSLTLITPYHRLRPGLLTTLLPTLNRFLFRQHEEHAKTPHFQSAILGIWSTLLSKSSTPVLELCQLLSQLPSEVTTGSVNKNSVYQRRSTNQFQKEHSEEDINKPSTSLVNPLQHFTSISSRKYSGTFSSCWLVDFCLRLIHPDVAVLAWDKLEPGNPLSCIGTDLQPNALRVQALSTLTHFIPSYFECLRPSMPLLIRTIRLCLRPGAEENRPLRTNLLRLCNRLVSRLIETAAVSENSLLAGSAEAEEATVNLQRNISWWTDSMDLILSDIQVDSEASECWWSCQVLSLFFELHALAPVKEDTSTLYARTISLLIDFCTKRHDGVQAKALRTLFSLAILENPFVSKSLVSESIKLCISLAENASFFLSSEIAYCVEMCTIRVLCKPQAFDIDWDSTLLMKTCLHLCSASLNEKNAIKTDSLSTREVPVEGCRNSDARRCEHAVHSISNLLELMSRGVLSMIDGATINDVFKVLTSSLNITVVNGAEKIRWNAALASTKILKNKCLTSMTLVSSNDKKNISNMNDYIVAPLIVSLCERLVKDKYFKVRAHASIALLMLFNNTLNGSMDDRILHEPTLSQESIIPMILFMQPIIKGVVDFLNTDFSTDVDDGQQSHNKEAEQHLIIGLFTSVMLMLHCAIISLLAIKNDDNIAIANENLRLIAECLEFTHLSNNLRKAINLATATSTAALSVIKIPRPLITAANILYDFQTELPSKQTKVSFFERYLVLEELDFAASLPALLRAVKIYGDLLTEALASTRNLLNHGIQNGLTQLPKLLINCQSVSTGPVSPAELDVAIKMQEYGFSTFRTVYD